jgi:hypothetical protein
MSRQDYENLTSEAGIAAVGTLNLIPKSAVDHILTIRVVVYQSSALISNALTGAIRGRPGYATAFFSRDDLDAEHVECHVAVPPMSGCGKSEVFGLCISDRYNGSCW